MEFKKVSINKYEYTCKNCGNSFEKSFQVNPSKCKDCGEYNTFEMTEIIVEIIEQLCPICNQFFSTSSYLNESISDEHVKWLANMITHYRHNHISSWNKSFGPNSSHYRDTWESHTDYDEMKSEINERAKRQILRKCKQYMIDNGFLPDHVKKLENTTENTLKLYIQVLAT